MTLTKLLQEIKEKSDKLGKMLDYGNKGYYSPQELKREFENLNSKRVVMEKDKHYCTKCDNEVKGEQDGICQRCV